MEIESLKQQHVFQFLTPDQIGALSEASERIPLKAGEEVYGRGEKADDYYVVLKGAVALRIPGRGSASLLVDELVEGAMFGSCISPAVGTYFCNARCVKDTELLKISTHALKKVLDNDPRMGYAIQAKISEIYFKRYVETMKKLQAILMNIPVEAESRQN